MKCKYLNRIPRSIASCAIAKNNTKTLELLSKAFDVPMSMLTDTKATCPKKRNPCEITGQCWKQPKEAMK